MITRKYLIFLTQSWKHVFDENFINIAKFSEENSKPSWKYHNFSSREKDVHVYSSPIYGRSIKWRKINNEMGGTFMGRNFLGDIFQGGVWWVGIFRVGIFPGEIFLVCETRIQKYFGKFTGIACVGVVLLMKLTLWLFIFTFSFISYSF